MNTCGRPPPKSARGVLGPPTAFDTVVTVNDVKLPSSADLMAPTLLALKGLGGSASREELYQSILETPVFAEASVGRPEDGSFEEQARRRVGFSLSKLKKLKAVDNVEWGHWTLTDTGREFLQLPTCEAELRHLDHESRVGKRPDKLLELSLIHISEPTRPY